MQRSELPKTMWVKVERAFFYAGRIQQPGSEIELPRMFALEMIAVHKAIGLPNGAAPALAAAEPPTGKPIRKGGDDAR